MNIPKYIIEKCNKEKINEFDDKLFEKECESLYSNEIICDIVIFFINN